MGLLVGDTMVVENGIWIQASRTYSHTKFQPEKKDFGFMLTKQHIDAGVTPPLAFRLANAIVNAQLGLKFEKPQKMDELCRQVLGCSIAEFFVEHEDEPQPVSAKSLYRTLGIEQDFDYWS